MTPMMPPAPLHRSPTACEDLPQPPIGNSSPLPQTTRRGPLGRLIVLQGRSNMKNWLIGALAVAVLAIAVPSVSDAKRVGAGKSTGMSRDMPAKTAPDAPAGKPMQNQAAATPAAGAAAAAPAAAAAKRNWMGPLAGLAAGLGLAALFSHLGMGEAFSNFMMMALLAVVAIFAVRFLMSRMGKKSGPALATAGATAGAGALSDKSWEQAQAQNLLRTSVSDTPATTAVGGGAPLAEVPPVAVQSKPAVVKAFVPAAFDSESFTRTAKMIFIRLQAANDTADLDDLRRFTTPELFASLRLDIQDRGTQAQTTDVQKLDAAVLDVAQEGNDQVVSVRFTGLVVEEKGAAAVSINEVWHLVKPVDDSRAWAIAGIEQMT
jgi:predicted lipid-binding transport protein (Tim44 family)